MATGQILPRARSNTAHDRINRTRHRGRCGRRRRGQEARLEGLAEGSASEDPGEDPAEGRASEDPAPLTATSVETAKNTRRKLRKLSGFDPRAEAKCSQNRVEKLDKVPLSSRFFRSASTVFPVS